MYDISLAKAESNLRVAVKKHESDSPIKRIQALIKWAIKDQQTFLLAKDLESENIAPYYPSEQYDVDSLKDIQSDLQIMADNKFISMFMQVHDYADIHNCAENAEKLLLKQKHWYKIGKFLGKDGILHGYKLVDDTMVDFLVRDIAMDLQIAKDEKKNKD